MWNKGNSRFVVSLVEVIKNSGVVGTLSFSNLEQLCLGFHDCSQMYLSACRVDETGKNSFIATHVQGRVLEMQGRLDGLQVYNIICSRGTGVDRYRSGSTYIERTAECIPSHPILKSA